MYRRYSDMERGWSALPVTMWSYAVFQWLEVGEVLGLRLVDRRTKETAEAAGALYQHSLEARYPTNDEYLSLQATSKAILRHQSAALAALHRLQTPPMLAVISDSRPAEDFARVAEIVYRLGHPGGKTAPEWAEARWQLANIELFQDVLTKFDGRLVEDASTVLSRYSSSDCSRAAKCLLSYLSEYVSGCSLCSEDYYLSVRHLQMIERRLAVLSKMSLLAKHPKLGS